MKSSRERTCFPFLPPSNFASFVSFFSSSDIFSQASFAQSFKNVLKLTWIGVLGVIVGHDDGGQDCFAIASIPGPTRASIVTSFDPSEIGNFGEA